MKISVGSIVRAPWRHHGDDSELTGSVVSERRNTVVIRWHDNGTVTAKGDESECSRDLFTDDDVVRL